jgi:ABC-2 type transport system ATP-binding protein
VSELALRAEGLGKRYRRHWAIEDCTLQIPRGHVVGLVGPNGAGKSTLLHLAAGLLGPTAGSIEVLGERPACDAAQLGRVGFVAQDASLYPWLSVEDHLKLGAHCNPTWDGASAHARVGELGLRPRQRAGKLSGGQRAQLSLTIALAKRPEVLLLDEPVASLDPLARREFLGLLMSTVAGSGVSIVLSSHLVSDVERVCDYLIVLVDSHVRVAGEIEDLVAAHHRLIGPREPFDGVPANQTVIAASETDRQRLLVVRSDGPVVEPGWQIESVSLEDVVLAYMGMGALRQGSPPSPSAATP